MVKKELEKDSKMEMLGKYFNATFEKLNTVFFSKKWFWLILTNIVLLFICVYLKKPLNETNDDTGMRALASGAYGDSQGYLVFTNIILGKLLTGLYNMIPGINWYSWFQIAVVLLAFSMIGNLFFERLGISKGLLVYLIVVRIFFGEVLLVLQFTRVSMLIGIIGYLYIVHGLQGVRRNSYIALGLFATMLSLLIRRQGFLAISVFIIPIVLFEFVLKKDFLQKLKQYLIVCLLFITLLGGCFYVDYYAYNKGSEEWRYYNEFNIDRSILVDYGFPDYEENKQAYQQIGVSPNDYEIYRRSMLLYDDTLSNEQIHDIVEIKEQEEKSVSWAEIKSSIKDNILKNQYVYVFILISLVFLYLNNSKRYLAIYISNTIIYISLFMNYILRDRLVKRVFLPTTLAFILVALYCFECDRIKQMKWNIKQSIITLVCVFLIFGTGFKDNYEGLVSAYTNTRNLYSEILADKSKKFVADLSIFRYNFFHFDAMHDFPENYFDNQIHTGGWLSRMPTLLKQKEEMGMDNLSKLVTLDNAYFYTKENELLFSTFIKEHYYPNEDISYAVVDNVGSYKIIKYMMNLNALDQTESSASLNKISYSSMSGYYKIDMSITSILDIGNMHDVYIESRDTVTNVRHTYRVNQNLFENIDGQTNLSAIIPVSDFEEVDSNSFMIRDFSRYEFSVVIKEGENYYRYRTLEQML